MQQAVQTIIQESIVALLVGWSLWQVLRRFAGRPLYLLQMRVVVQLQRYGWPRVAAYLMPVAPTVAGCSQGCGGCNQNAAPSCASQASPHTPDTAADSVPIKTDQVNAESTVSRPVQWR